MFLARDFTLFFLDLEIRFPLEDLELVIESTLPVWPEWRANGLAKDALKWHKNKN
jgi:hypothetical protein